MAQQKISEKNLLDFKSFGNISIMHITDIHGQLKPLYFREPDIQIGYLFDLFSMGTILSFIMIVSGLVIINSFKRKNGR